MRRGITYPTYFTLFLVLITGIASGLSTAQETTKTNLGVVWESNPSASEISSKVSDYEKLGISFLELTHPVEKYVLDSLANYPFRVLIRFEKKFLIAEEIKQHRDEYIEDYQKLILEYSEYENVIAYGLFSLSQSFNSEFIEQINGISDQLKSITNREFYEISTGPYNSLDFSITEIGAEYIPEQSSIILLSKDYERNDIHLFSDLLSQQPDVLFIDVTWLDEAMNDYTPLQESLIEFNSGGYFILPLPQNTVDKAEFNWPVLIFVLIWISMGIHISISQTYKPLIFRFFTGHRFFVDDIMRYRERSFLSGTFMFFQHAAFTGLVIYILSALLISEKGLEALFGFLPQIAVFGQNYFSLFIISVLISILVQLIGLFWLYFPSKSMTHFSQALNLYTWIFHIDFILVSIMLILLLSGGSGTLILILGVLFIINWLTAFLLTSFDSSKYLIQKRVSYILYTFGLHTVVNIVVLVIMLSNNFLIDVLELIFVI